MKKVACFLLFAVMGITVSLAQQTVTLTFTGIDQNNTYRRIDSVKVENQTRNWSETICFPDTIYVLSVGTDVDDYQGNEMHVMTNPFAGITKVNIHTVKDEVVNMKLVDVSGKTYAGYNARLSAGNNLFEISLTIPQMYILSLRTSEGMRSVKLLNTGRADVNRISPMCKGDCAKVSIKATKSHEFELGDEMQYVGYSIYYDSILTSMVVTQSQFTDEVIALEFDVPTPDSNLTNLNSCVVGVVKPNETGVFNHITAVSDYEGNTYQVVQIGGQCWMKENLRSTCYADGTLIPSGTTSSGNMHSYSEPYRYVPDNNASNVSLYGYLYNWPAVMHEDTSSFTNPSGVQGVCPTGWHVPSDAEWTQLTSYVGSQSQYVCGGDSTYIGKALSATTGWISSGGACHPGNQAANENNSTGFSALPAGQFFYPQIDFFGYLGCYWTATQTTNNGWDINSWSRQFQWSSANVVRSDVSKQDAISVRCLRD